MINFLNPALIWLGLAGVSLPILAHLLSKRRYDVVDWGAMQFLELRQNARRKILLEQILLMALRIGLIALVALAFMRPWTTGSWGGMAVWLLMGFRLLLCGLFVYFLVRPIGGSWNEPRQIITIIALPLAFFATFLPAFSKERLTRAVSTQNRDVVIIVDGSYSMGWKGRGTTPHSNAVLFAKHFLDDLGSGDSVALIDARDKPRAIIEVPTRDFKRVREELDSLPPPSGKADLALATRKAVQILSRTNNLAREIVVVTDRQAKSWRPDDEALWVTFDDQLNQPAVRPRTWVMEVGSDAADNLANFAVSRIKLNREVTAVGYPVRAQAQLSASGGNAAVFRKAYLEIDGQRLEGKTVQKKIDPGAKGQATVEFEYVFKEPGSHRIGIVLEDDNLPGDNRSDAVVVVTEAVPALLVDGDPHPDELIKSETVFAHSALTPEDNPAPWVKADVVPWQSFSAKLKELENYDAVVLANVPSLSAGQLEALKKYVADGGGVFFAIGDKINRNHYADQLFAKGRGLLPVEPLKVIEVTDPKQSVYPLDKSLEVPWMQRFTLKAESDFTEIRYGKRWDSRLADVKPPEPKKEKPKPKEPKPVKIGQPVVAATYTTGEPLLVTRKYGRGRVVTMTNPIDGDWSTMVAKDDFTALMHEIVFFLASARSTRNVEVGAPLVLSVPEDMDVSNHLFFGPGDTSFKFVTGAVEKGLKTVRMNETTLPGVYAFRKKTGDDKPDVTSPAEYFVVNFDRSESDLTPLKEEQQETLAKSSDPQAEEPRMAFVPNRESMIEQMFKDNSRSELWWLLLLGFLGLLVFEVVMTRKMVEGGHAVMDDAADDTPVEPRILDDDKGPPPLQGGPRRHKASVVSLGENDFVDDTEFARA